MPIKYYLKKTKIGEATEIFHRAIVDRDRIVTQEEMIESIVRRGSTLTHADVTAVFRILKEEVNHHLMNGCSVHMDHARFRMTIRGKFRDIDDSFDPARHDVEILSRPGVALLGLMPKKPVVEKVKQRPNFEIEKYADVATAQTNGPITPGKNGILHGKGLSFDPSDAEQGVFYVKNDGTQVRSELYSLINPGRVIAENPDTLEAGTPYFITLRKKNASGRPLFVSLDAETATP